MSYFMSTARMFDSDVMIPYFERFGRLPPAEIEGPYYGPLLPELHAPFGIVWEDYRTGWGEAEYRIDRFPVDPYRQNSIFPAEEMGEMQYNAPRNPEGWVTFRGYPLRWYRSGDGLWGMILTNGPDGDADIGPDLLDRFDVEGIQGEGSAILRDFAVDWAGPRGPVGDAWRTVIAPGHMRRPWIDPGKDGRTSPEPTPTSASPGRETLR